MTEQEYYTWRAEHPEWVPDPATQERMSEIWLNLLSKLEV